MPAAYSPYCLQQLGQAATACLLHGRQQPLVEPVTVDCVPPGQQLDRVPGEGAEGLQQLHHTGQGAASCFRTGSSMPASAEVLARRLEGQELAGGC